MTSGSRFLRATGALAAGATAVTYAAYRRDIRAAVQRVETGGQVLETPSGPIEFAEAGDGPAVLLIHGAGGGFDQGLDLGRAFLGDDYRILAPSRFGYLGTPLPADASAEAQAEAHLRLLDALQLETVPVVGVSAGAPSAMQLCLRHPERCSALVLAVPLVYHPQRVDARAPSPIFATLLNAIASSDFLFWTARRVAHAALLRTILGTPVEVYRTAAAGERANVDEMLRGILPITRRLEGIWNDAAVSSSLTRYALESIHAPTLLISAEDDLYGTYPCAVYTAENIPGAKFLGFRSGGHLLVGHDADVRTQVRKIVGENVARAA